MLTPAATLGAGEPRSLTARERQIGSLTIDTGLIADALQNPDTVLETDIDLAGDFLAGTIKHILAQLTAVPQSQRQGVRDPLCSLPPSKLTPQHAASHGLSVGEMMIAHPDLGVSHPVEVWIVLTMKDLLANEEVVDPLVAGAGFDPEGVEGRGKGPNPARCRVTKNKGPRSSRGPHSCVGCGGRI